MGYTTDFYGTLSFNKPVTQELKDYINAFADKRHMKRDVDLVRQYDPDWLIHGYNGKLGEEGAYYIGGQGFCGQDRDTSIVDYNTPPKGVPGLWCNWIINDNGELEWNGAEKFYDYDDWLNYLIVHFFEPKGYILNGEIGFQGEDSDDFGKIEVKDNYIELIYGTRCYGLSDFSDTDLITECKKRGLM